MMATKGKGDDVLREVLKGLREGTPEQHKQARKMADKQARINKAAADNARRRKQKPRTGSGHGDVIDTGMFK
jgi:hypothetical protein